MPRVLVLRPEPGASMTVKRVRALGLDARAVPLFKVEPVAWQAPRPAGFDGLLLTSANAVRHGGDQLLKLLNLKVHAVGEATAAAARAAGFKVATTGEGGIDQLLGKMSASLRLLHLCGADRRSPEQAQQKITRTIVYRAQAIDRPNLCAVDGSVALIHSPRAGRRFAELMLERSSIIIAAISQATADAAGDGWKAVEIAEQPTEDALLALAARLCNNPDPE
jgi:uroporphyrinogen-III synthase